MTDWPLLIVQSGLNAKDCTLKCAHQVVLTGNTRFVLAIRTVGTLGDDQNQPKVKLEDSKSCLSYLINNHSRSNWSSLVPRSKVHFFASSSRCDIVPGKVCVNAREHCSNSPLRFSWVPQCKPWGGAVAPKLRNLNCTGLYCAGCPHKNDVHRPTANSSIDSRDWVIAGIALAR